MAKEQAINKLQNLVEWVNQNTVGIEFTGGEKEGIAIGCLDVAVEHQVAISLLFSKGLIGSAFAFRRILFEATIKGWWFWRCANEEDVERYKNHRFRREFRHLISDIETAIGEELTLLNWLKNNVWSEMNDFTHSGIIQVSNRHNNGKLEAVQSDAQIIDRVYETGVLGLLAATLLNLMSNKSNENQKFLDKMTEYINDRAV